MGELIRLGFVWLAHCGGDLLAWNLPALWGVGGNFRWNGHERLTVGQLLRCRFDQPLRCRFERSFRLPTSRNLRHCSLVSAFRK